MARSLLSAEIKKSSVRARKQVVHYALSAIGELDGKWDIFSRGSDGFSELMLLANLCMIAQKRHLLDKLFTAAWGMFYGISSKLYIFIKSFYINAYDDQQSHSFAKVFTPWIFPHNFWIQEFYCISFGCYGTDPIKYSSEVLGHFFFSLSQYK